MEWNKPYRVARGLTLQIADDGELLAASARAIRKLPLDAVAVLCGFARAITVEDAHTELSQRYDFDREGFEAVVEELVATGALAPADQAEPTRTSDGPRAGGGPRAGSLDNELRVMRDLRRIQSYQRAIERAAPGKVVVEIGAGVGLFATFAAKAGARRVFAIETSSAADVADEIFAANGVADRVTLIRASSFDAELPEPGEVLVHDLIDTDPLADNVLPMIEDARRRLLVPGAQLVPFQLDLSLVGVELTRPEDLVDDTAAIDEIAALCGVELAPFAERLRRARAKQALPRPSGPLLPRNVLTDEVAVCSIDLRKPWQGQLPETPIDVNLTVHTRARLAGAVALFRAHLDDRSVLGNQPWLAGGSWELAWHGLPRARVAQMLNVFPNDRIALKATIERSVRGMHLGVELG